MCFSLLKYGMLQAIKRWNQAINASSAESTVGGKKARLLLEFLCFLDHLSPWIFDWYVIMK